MGKSFDCAVSMIAMLCLLYAATQCNSVALRSVEQSSLLKQSVITSKNIITIREQMFTSITECSVGVEFCIVVNIMPVMYCLYI